MRRMIAKRSELWNRPRQKGERADVIEETCAPAIAGIPLLAGYDGPVERLGGLTNRVYRLGDCCLRVPGKGTEQYINRGNEAVAAREAARAGIGPEVLHFDADTA